MTKQEKIEYWITSAETDFRAMNNLYKSKDYVWSLFLGHLVIEKLLKAIAVKNNEANVPKVHDLNKISKIAGLVVEESLKDILDEITSFNIEARYPDYKNEFFKKCTPEYCLNQINKINEIRKWLLDQLMTQGE